MHSSLSLLNDNNKKKIICVLDGHGESITSNASVKTVSDLRTTQAAAAAINQTNYHSTYCTFHYYTSRRRENRIKTHTQNVATALQIVVVVVEKDK